MTEAMILIRACHTLRNSRTRIAKQNWREREEREAAATHLLNAEIQVEKAIQAISTVSEETVG